MQSSIKDNPYSKQLYIFLSENRDQLFGNFAIECKDALDAAYHLSGKFLADKSDMTLIRNHIALLCTAYPRLHTVILSIAWTMLSVLPKKDCLVDAIIGDALVAIEFKSSKEVQLRHLGGLKAFKEEHPDCRCIVVSMDERQRLLQGFEIIPANDFLRMLWNDEIVNPEML